MAKWIKFVWRFVSIEGMKMEHCRDYRVGVYKEARRGVYIYIYIPIYNGKLFKDFVCELICKVGLIRKII